MSAIKTPSVWIVDDDTDDQYLFEAALKQLIPPVAVKMLNDGEEVLPALQESSSPPRLILLDLNMPLLNGFEVLEQLRADSDYQQIPVVVLTTSSRQRDKEKALMLGANGFLTKPPSMNSIIELLSQLAKEWELS